MTLSRSALLGCALVLSACGGTPPPAAPAPDVTLTATPAHLGASGSVTLTASVTGGAATVSFYRDGALLGTDATAPYTWTDPVRVQAAGTVHYRAVAGDAAGRRAEAAADVTLRLEQIAGTVQEARAGTGPGGQPTLALVPWTGGSGTFSLSAFAPGREPLVLSVPLAADGSFRLDLPTPAPGQLQPFAPAPETSCAGTVTASDPAAQGVSPLTTVEADRSGLVRPLRLVAATEQGVTLASAMLVYVDRPLTLRGTALCLIQTETYDNLALQPGWNEVSVTEAYVRGSGISYTYRNADVPDNWVYVPPDGLGFQSLNAPRSHLFR